MRFLDSSSLQIKAYHKGIQFFADEVDQLESLAKFYMLDFATILLGEIERWMLTASPNMIDLSSFADTSEKFLGPNTLLSDMRGRFPAAQDEVSNFYPAWNRQKTKAC